VAQSGDKATVINGVLYPSYKDIKTIVTSLRRKVKADPHIAKQFKKDPRRTLAAFGLNEDVQNELLRDMGLKTALRFCICTGCCDTCWCTGCCITSISIG
jgi:hypothetical protein